MNFDAVTDQACQHHKGRIAVQIHKKLIECSKNFVPADYVVSKQNQIGLDRGAAHKAIEDFIEHQLTKRLEVAVKSRSEVLRQPLRNCVTKKQLGGIRRKVTRSD